MTFKEQQNAIKLFEEIKDAIEKGYITGEELQDIIKFYAKSKEHWKATDYLRKRKKVKELFIVGKSGHLEVW